MANLFRANKKGSGGVAVDYLTITTMPTKTTYTINDTLDLTGLVVTATFLDGVTANVTSAITTSPAAGSTLTTEGTIPVTVSYGGATVSFNVTCSALPASLEDATWAEIQAAIHDGTLSQFASEGDTKSVVIGGNTFHLQLASINDGTGTAGSYYPAHTADFISVELLPDSHVINSSRSNVGGWNGCEMRTYLNNTIYPTLPSDLRDVIIEKTHMRTEGNQSTNFISASDKLWLPTKVECFGAGTIASYGEDFTYNKQYSIFTNDNSRKKKKSNSNTFISWWLSTPRVDSSTLFGGVSEIGFTADYSYTHTDDLNGVALCLRIG